MFPFMASSFEVVILMVREADTPTVYDDVIREVGAPNNMVTDNV